MDDNGPLATLKRFIEGDMPEEPASVDDSASDVGGRMAEARTAAGLSQESVANQLGVKASTIDKWERGAASPRSNWLSGLAGILGVTPTWLLMGFGAQPTATDELLEIKAGLARVQSQLSDALAEVDSLSARLDAIGD